MSDPQAPTIYSLQLTEEEALDLAAGTVPHTVRAMARWLCEDLDAQLRRNADRPVRERHGTQSKARI